jgi:hypothetical protein
MDKPKYVSPGVYVKEVEISYYIPPKKLIRIRKIKKIFK